MSPDDPERQGEGPYRSAPKRHEPQARWSRAAIAAVMLALVGWGLVYYGVTGDEELAMPIGGIALVLALVMGVATMRRLAIVPIDADDAQGPTAREELDRSGAPAALEEPPQRGRALARLSVWLVLGPIALGVIGTCLLFFACMGGMR